MKRKIWLAKIWYTIIWSSVWAIVVGAGVDGIEGYPSECLILTANERILRIHEEILISSDRVIHRMTRHEYSASLFAKFASSTFVNSAASIYRCFAVSFAPFAVRFEHPGCSCELVSKVYQKGPRAHPTTNILLFKIFLKLLRN